VRAWGLEAVFSDDVTEMAMYRVEKYRREFATWKKQGLRDANFGMIKSFPSTLAMVGPHAPVHRRKMAVLSLCEKGNPPRSKTVITLKANYHKMWLRTDVREWK